jgi:6-pyruvoyltetrahydropterin/6-carboxytetrahydropterin synthase
MVTNLSDLDSFAQREMLDLFDHANLNTLEPFLDGLDDGESMYGAVADLR